MGNNDDEKYTPDTISYFDRVCRNIKFRVSIQVYTVYISTPIVTRTSEVSVATEDIDNVTEEEEDELHVG